MKKILLSFVLATCTLISLAQQDPQYTMWQFDRFSFNPAVGGSEKMNCLSVFHRDQWDGLDHDPKTYLVNYHGAFGKNRNIGAGATFYTEVLGQQQNTIFRVAPSYHLALNGGNYLSFGASLGMIQSKLGANWIYIDAGDPSIPTGEVSQSVFDLNLGTMIYQPNKYYVGLSATHLTGSEMDALHIKMAQHLYFMGGYQHPIAGGNLVLRPNVLVKTDLAATQFDVNADVLWNQMLWGGVAFRPGDAIAPFVGFQKNFAPKQAGAGGKEVTSGIKIGYSYDVTTSQLKDYSAGSHEVFVTYCWSINEIPIRARHSNPRFL